MSRKSIRHIKPPTRFEDSNLCSNSPLPKGSTPSSHPRGDTKIRSIDSPFPRGSAPSCHPRGGRKIRRTQDLICLQNVDDEPSVITEPNNATKNPVTKNPIPEDDKSPIVLSTEARNSGKKEFKKEYERQQSQDSQTLPQTTSSIDMDNKPEHHPQADINCEFEHSLANSEMPGRKIVKAKRHLQIKLNHNIDQPKIRVDPTDNDNEMCNFKTSIPHEELENNFLVVETLPSSIVPSENSLEDVSPTLNKYFSFKSSQENLNPSTSGNVEPVPTKRRTYELEDSVIDISSLKSLSEKESERMSSFSVNSEFKTPDNSKVTRRRRWDKSSNFSPNVTDQSPNWVNKKEFSESRNVSTKKTFSLKKITSKVKLPNFAAIHQKAMDRAESLSEYKERKDLRSKLLLAGLKPTTVEKATTKDRKVLDLTPKNSRKELRFASGTNDKTTSPFVPLPNTPRPKFIPPTSPSTPPIQFIDTLKNNKKAQTSQIPLVVKVDVNHQIPLKEKNIILKPPVWKPLNRQNFFAFKATSENKIAITVDTKKEEMQKKSVKTLSRIKTNTVDTRRCVIKGVRSNRRFELLMNMRKGK